MRKYWVVLQVAISERLVYRADFFLATFLRFIPIITTILLWDAVYKGAGKTHVGGLAYDQMVGYYLFIMVARAFGSMPRLASGIATDIRDGELRKYLLQPVSYLNYQLALRTAHKLVYFLMAAAPYALVFWMCRRYLPEAPSPTMFALGLLSLVQAFLIGFAINSLIGLLGFWFLEVASFMHLFMTAQYFLSGHMFPLSLLPDGFRSLITWLPFAYETYYPTLILLQRVEPGQIAEILMVQVAWVVTLWCAVYFVWRRGLRRYAAFGG